MAWYTERQRFTQPWLLLIVIGGAALLWYNVVLQLVFGVPSGSRPISDPILVVIWLVVGVGIPLMLLLARLDTRVGEDGLHVRFFPFHLKPRRWSFDEIASAEPRTYSPLREYGGWGIRYGRQGGAYNASGDRGVQLVLRSGKRLLIGSQQPELLAQSIQRGMRQKG